MAGAALLAVAVLLAGAALSLRPGKALIVVLATIVLVPGSLPLPAGPGVLTIHRFVVLAALLGLVWRCALGELPWVVLRPPPLTSRFLVVLGILAVVGVGLAQPTTDLSAAVRGWMGFAAQLMVFVTAVALARSSERPAAGLLALVVVVAIGAGIGVGEHYTGWSYARFWYHGVPELLPTDLGQELARRGGDVRVRVAGDFTLAYSYATAAVLPLFVVAAALTRGRRRVALMAALPLVLLAVVWTYSRSVIVPAVVVLLVMVVAVRDRVLQIAASAVLSVGAAVVFASPAVQGKFSLAVDQGSIDVRLDRLPAVTALAAQHPFRGFGLSGLAALGFPSTDSSYLLAYADVGMVGLAALVGLLVAACAVSFRGTLTSDPTARLMSLGAATGATVIVLGGLSFDAFTTPAVAELFWVLIALAVVAAEAGPRAVRVHALSLVTRAGVCVGLVALGLGLRLFAPTHVAQSYRFDTLQPDVETLSAPTYTGRELRTTACDAVAADLRGQRTIRMTCSESGQVPGQGLLRLQAASGAVLEEATLRTRRLIRTLPTLEHVQLEAVGPAERGTPSVMRTAPVWLPLFGALLLLPFPGRRRVDA